MSSRRFLVSPEALLDDVVKLPDDEALHARKVLRLKKGDAVQLIDGKGKKALANIAAINKHEVTCDVLERREQQGPQQKLVICPGLLKGPAMDMLAAKLTELMVDELHPFNCARSVPQLKDPYERLMRWERLAGQAIKQCGAAQMPLFNQPQAFEDVLELPPEDSCRIMLYEAEGRLSLGEALQGDWPEIWALIGPEGGFTLDEVQLAAEAGFSVCGLAGGSILRAETASLALASVVRFST
jgi:16S rRNA (uracil1498-N3)-methyltransferase